MRHPKLTLLTLLILLSALPTLAQDFEYEGIWYTVLDPDAKTCQTKAGRYDFDLSSYVPGNNCAGDITIPTVVSDGTDDYTVINVGFMAFYNCPELKSMKLPVSVTSIGNGAFSSCSNLTSINIPEGVTSIEDDTFKNNTSLTSIILPEGMTSIGSHSFYYCTNLASINIPEGVTSIGDYAFQGCSCLTSMIIPLGVTSIEGYTFKDCSGLTSIILPESLTSIGNLSFDRCSSLTSINIPDGVTSIGVWAFKGCSELTSINIPAGLTLINTETFMDCSNLTSIIIPDGVTSIGSSAFQECYALTSLILPGSLASIGEKAFNNCASLKEVFYNATNLIEGSESIFSSSYVSVDIYGTATLHTPNATLEDVQGTVPWSLFKHIEASDGSFVPEIKVDSITLSQSSAELKVGESITLTATVFPEDAIDKTITWTSSNPDIASVDTEGNVTAIALGEATITASCCEVSATCSVSVVPTTVDSITLSQTTAQLKVGENLTLTATVLPEDATDKTITWTSSNPDVASVDSEGNVSAIALGETTITSSCGEVSAECSVSVVETSVESIALSQSSADLKVGESLTLTATVLPEDATDKTINWTSSNPDIASVDTEGNVSAISAGETSIIATCGSISADCLVTVIDNSLSNGEDFEYEGIWYTVLDAQNKTCETKAGHYEGQTLIPGNNFEGDLSIPTKSVYDNIEYSVIKIGRYGFGFNSGLTSVVIPETITDIPESAFENCTNLTSASIPESVTSIGVYAFDECESLMNVDLPKNLKSMGYVAFSRCSSLTSIVIPESLTVLENHIFSGCSNLKTIDLPSTLTQIGNYVFDGCDSQAVITYRAEVPIEALDNIFSTSTYQNGTLHTPNATLEAVQSTTPWNLFKHIIASDGFIGMGLATGEAFEYEGIWYTVLDAQNMTCETKAGHYEDHTLIPGNNFEGDLSIPSKAVYDNIEYSVIKIGRYGFGFNSGLTSVVIPETITDIPESAFENCTNLTSASIPEPVTSIGIYAFDECESLKNVVLPKNLESMGYAAFSRCSSLTSIAIPESLTVLENHIFSGCSNLKAIDLPSTLTQIGNYVFDGCYSYAEITYRAEVPIEAIDNIFSTSTYQSGTLHTPNATLKAVQSTTPWNLFKRVVASDGSIGNGLSLGEQFSVDGVTYTVIDEENQIVKTAEGSANGEGANNFSGDLILSSPIVFDNVSYDVTEIGDYSFSGSEYLTSVTIPASIENIGEGAFSDCIRLTSLIWQGNTPLQSGIVESIANPNLLVYVDSIHFAPEGLDYNIVVMNTTDGIPSCERLILLQGYAFHPAIDFISNYSSLTHDYTQSTIIGESAGWETIVLPFDAKRIFNDKHGELTPFAAVSDLETQSPFWLYEADSENEWKEASAIKAGVPYIISMPNNPAYLDRFNIDGPVTFSCSEPTWITASIASPYIVNWNSGQEFSSLWLPLDPAQAANAMGLNVGIDDEKDENGELLPPGSAFIKGGTPLPLEAFVSSNGAAGLKRIMGNPTSVLPIEAPNGLDIKSVDGTLILRSDSDRKVDIFAIDGVHIRRIILYAGVTETLRDLTPGLYLIAGEKVLIK